VAEGREIDIEELMERMRESVRQRRSASSVPPFDRDQTAADFEYLRTGYDIGDVSFVSHRPVLGLFAVTIKKVLRKLLTPVLARQTAYNAANARVIAGITAWFEQQAEALGTINDRLDVVERSQIRLREDVSEIHVQLRELRDNASGVHVQLRELRDNASEVHVQLRELRDNASGVHVQLREEILALGSQLLATESQLGEGLRVVQQSSGAARERVSSGERKLRRILHILQTGQPRDTPREPEAGGERPTLPPPELEPAFDYAGFEERFRGTQEDIKERHRAYVEFFERQENVLEIGSGRGEFLELLAEAGIKARGVDLDLDMVLLCREKGLDVVEADAFAYLQALPDDSLGGIFAAQVIEHLDVDQIVSLPKLCHRKLRRGGVLLLETLNPECLSVHYRWFWMDPTHTRLIHPETLKFLFESAGFTGARCRFQPPPSTSPSIPPLTLHDQPTTELHRFNEAIQHLSALLFASTDYAVIGTK